MLTPIHLLLYCFLSFANHDYHVSKCEIEYNSEKSRLEVCQFIFLDDLELAFEYAGLGKQGLCTEFEKEQADSILTTYINDRLLVMNQNDTIQIKILGKEISNDLSAVNVYLYSEAFTLDSDIHFRSNLLTELYDDQNNMVYWTSPSGKKGYFVLNREKTIIQLPYE